MGAKLEELLWGLIDEMGATDMVWRAGSASGVNAADGGRDIEATFTEPQEDGSPASKRWWIEAKGRTGTISRQLVADSAQTALAYSEVDIVNRPGFDAAVFLEKDGNHAQEISCRSS